MFLITKTTFHGEHTSPDEEILGYIQDVSDMLIYLNQFGNPDYITDCGKPRYVSGDLHDTYYTAISLEKINYKPEEMYVCKLCYKVFMNKSMMYSKAICRKCINDLGNCGDFGTDESNFLAKSASQTPSEV